MSNAKVIVSKSRLLAANNVIKNMASSLNGVVPVVAKTGNEKRIESCKKVGSAKKRAIFFSRTRASFAQMMLMVFGKITNRCRPSFGLAR